MLVSFSIIYYLLSLLCFSNITIAGNYTLKRWIPTTATIHPGEIDHFTYIIDPSEIGQDYFNSVEVLLFITGSIRSYPKIWLTTGKIDQVDLRITGYFENRNDTKVTARFYNGYLSTLATAPLTWDAVYGAGSNQNIRNLTEEYQKFHIEVEIIDRTYGLPLSADDGKNEDLIYSLGISEEDQIFQWDDKEWMNLLTADMNSILLTSGNSSSRLTTFLNSTDVPSNVYEIYLYSMNDSHVINQYLNNSYTAIKYGPYLATSNGQSQAANYQISLEEESLTIQKQYVGNENEVQEMFFITGLEPNTTYSLYLTRKIGHDLSFVDVESGGIIFGRQLITTKPGDTCTNIFNLNLCSGVAYSVPTPRDFTTNRTAIALEYDYLVASIFLNFSAALQVIPCDISMDSSYSPLRSCDDCTNSYVNWLCSVMIPRCSESENVGSIFRRKNANRNSLLDTKISPIDNYYELLPCIDSCHQLVKDCPADFGFSCPQFTKFESLFKHSYSFFNSTSGIETCNFIGNRSNLVDRARMPLN